METMMNTLASRIRDKLIELVNAWPEFDDDECDVSGSEVVEWLGEFREECKALINEME
jgi:hypothetical protein